MREDRAPGIALVVGAFALLGVSLLEFAAGDARGDGDNPAESLEYLAQYGHLYLYSGLALVTAAAALVVGAIGIHRLVRSSTRTSLAFDVITAVGVLAGGFLTVSGVMRMQATGTVPHIQGLDQDWGEAAYLVVQIAGTQGLLSAGFITLAAWLIGVAIVSWRRGVRALAPLALLPSLLLLVLAADLTLPFLSELGGAGLFLTYIAAIIFGLPTCCLGYGIALLLPRVRARLARVDVGDHGGQERDAADRVPA